MALKTIIVRWTGPFTLEQVRQMKRGNGIYLLVGRQKYERKDQIQYCGITKRRFCNRVNPKHPAVQELHEENLSVWLAEVVYPATFVRSDLELAEHCFVSFWQCPLNNRKTVYFPSNSVCFISQWFTREGKPRRNRPPIVTGLPDVLWWDEERWRTGKLRVHAAED